MANAVSSEAAANTGFKNIKDYLQEANLETLKKNDVAFINDFTTIDNSGRANAMAQQEKQRKVAHSVTMVRRKQPNAQMPYIPAQ